MTRDQKIGWMWVAAIPIVAITGFTVGSGRTAQVAAGLTLDQSGDVFEVETDRLVCGVVRGETYYSDSSGDPDRVTLARTAVGTSFAISCVPKIPGLFDERIER